MNGAQWLARLLAMLEVSSSNLTRFQDYSSKIFGKHFIRSEGKKIEAHHIKNQRNM